MSPQEHDARVDAIRAKGFQMLMDGKLLDGTLLSELFGQSIEAVRQNCLDEQSAVSAFGLFASWIGRGGRVAFIDPPEAKGRIK